MPEQVRVTLKQAKEAVAILLALAETAEEAEVHQLNIGPPDVETIKKLAKRIKENK